MVEFYPRSRIERSYFQNNDMNFITFKENTVVHLK